MKTLNKINSVYRQIPPQYKTYDTSEKECVVYILTQEELEKMYNHKFDSDRLSRVRDTFCFACFTGLRFSDILKLKRENIFDGFIDLVVKKTNDHKKSH